MWRLDGYDVSHWNCPFPWERSRAAGHRLAAFKGGTGNHGVDEFYLRNRAATANLGFEFRAIYWWQLPHSQESLESQVAWWVQNMGDLTVGECVEVDQENPVTLLDPSECRAALDILQAHYPDRAVHYGFGGYANRLHYNLKPYRWWRGSATNLPPDDAVVVLQFDKQNVDGVGLVDCNTIIDEAALRKLCGGNVIPYGDLEARSRSVLAAPYVFGSAVPRDATVEEVIQQGVDCAQYIAWVFGPWLTVPDYTGDIYSWAQKNGRLIPVDQRQPGDLVLRSPGYRNISIGHVGMALGDVSMIRQARSSHTVPNCGDWPVTAGTWQTAVRMGVAVSAPADAPIQAPTSVDIEEANVRAVDVHVRTDDQGNGWTNLVEGGIPVPFAKLLTATVVTVPPDNFGFGYHSPGAQIADHGAGGGIIVIEGWTPKADVTVRVLVAP